MMPRIHVRGPLTPGGGGDAHGGNSRAIVDERVLHSVGGVNPARWSSMEYSRPITVPRAWLAPEEGSGFGKIFLSDAVFNDMRMDSGSFGMPISETTANGRGIPR